ncbi:sigma-70 family RNA polymerase sigma factor [Bacteroidales bacterium SW299]|nr:sigma-70 family RNA polymerase sigma factor [Bacteroidales bacterium SW299]
MKQNSEKLYNTHRGEFAYPKSRLPESKTGSNSVPCATGQRSGSKLSIIEQLPPRQQEVFRLSREHQLTYQEIAQKLQISIKTVERHMGEALKFLRKNLRLYAIFLMLMD